MCEGGRGFDKRKDSVKTYYMCHKKSLPGNLFLNKINWRKKFEIWRFAESLVYFCRRCLLRFASVATFFSLCHVWEKRYY